MAAAAACSPVMSRTRRWGARATPRASHSSNIRVLFMQVATVSASGMISRARASKAARWRAMRRDPASLTGWMTSTGLRSSQSRMTGRASSVPGSSGEWRKEPRTWRDHSR